MITSIHQPNFLPWLGYFKKIEESDSFIILDHIKPIRSSWSNRSKFLISKKHKWLTCPIKIRGCKTIKEIKIQTKNNWKKKIFESIKQNYSKKKFFDEKLLHDVIYYETDSLIKYNINFIRKFMKILDINSKIYFSSNLILKNKKIKTLRSSEMLIGLCDLIETKTYLAGDGAETYEKTDLYTKKNIIYKTLNLKKNKNTELVTEILNNGFSILDTFFNYGLDTTKTIIKTKKKL